MKYLRSLLVEDLVFSVYSERQARSVVGEGLGRSRFLSRLERLLDHVEVTAFEPASVSGDGIWCHARINFTYRHRAHRMAIDGSMRTKFAFVGHRIAHFELFHDTRRMRAFYDMGRLQVFCA